jgi:hypothetical protein
MAKREESQEKKLLFANFVAEKKNILFGKFSHILTFKDKTDAWNEAVNLCADLGLIKKEQHKNIEYVKVMWGNMKKRAIANKNYRHKTGAPRDKTREMNATDHKVIEIIGENSPIVIGLGLPESTGRNLAVASPSAIYGYAQSASMPGRPHNSYNEASNSSFSSQSADDFAPNLMTDGNFARSLALPETPKSGKSVYGRQSETDLPMTPQQFRRLNQAKRKNSSSAEEIATLKKQKYERQNELLELHKKNLQLQHELLAIKLRKQKNIEV